MIKIIAHPGKYSNSYLSVLHNTLTGWRNQHLKDRDWRGRPKIFNDKGQRIKIKPLGTIDKSFEINTISWLIEAENVITGEKIFLRCGSKFGEDTLKSNLPKAVRFF